MKRRIGLRVTILTLIVTLMMRPLPPAHLGVLAQAEIAQTGVGTIHLPLVAAPPGPPDFVIMSPANGLTVSGTSFFAVQALEPNSITAVSFQAGTTDLGTDSTADDGFQVFLDASQLPAGTVKLAATATGPTGLTTTKSIDVTVVPVPPASATVGANGSTLATGSGSTIVVPPGAVSGEATISIEDKTQEQVTQDEGIDWDALGVTFLGAIDVQTSAPLAKPVSVSSVGFGNRIQPGQTVVTYRILPDADGDGVGELVVVNGANLAPNGTIVSSPVEEILVNEVAIGGNSVRTAAAAQGELRGPPGTAITIQGAGFNPLSLSGNVGIWTSLVDGQVLEVPGLVQPNPTGSSNQIFSTLIPPLAPGTATLTLINKSTGSTAGPFNVTVEAPEPLDRPGAEVFDLFLADTIEYLGGVPTSTPVEDAVLADLITGITQSRVEFQALVAAGLTPEETQALDAVALMIANSDIYEIGTAGVADYSADALFSDGINLLWGVATILGGLALLPATTPLIGIAAGFTIVIGIAITAYYACRMIRGGVCFDDPPSPPPACTTTPIATGPGTTGMGSAPPPGGNGCGNAGGSPPNSVRSASLAQFESGRFIVKIFPLAGGRLLTPFTGATDSGGYFFIPLIPQGEPFRALATDQLTGASVSVEGVGPATGESTLMYFDFTNAQQNRYEIAIGDTVTNGVPISGAGNIEIPHGLDIYTFNAASGQRVFVDVLELNLNVHWELLDPNGESIFSECLACGDPGAFTLAEAGTYTIRVGDDSSEEVGTYQFKLWDVPPSQEFDITIGDTITNGVPGAGAGNIETPGVLDIYTFEAAAGQRIFIDALELDVNIRWGLLDPAGESIFSECLACGDPGTFTLSDTGTYTLTVGSNTDNSVGTYQFKVWDVPNPQEFSIAIGDTVSNGSPGAGAGNIESPGVLDIYTFEAVAGQRIFLETLELEVNIRWEMVDPAGESIFSECLACGDPGAFTLADAGTYTITVGATRDASVGTYQFKIWDVPASQEFAITVGDTISNGVPGPGAGNIESPGVLDIYTFEAAAGQQIFLDVLELDVNIRWELHDPSGESIFNECLACGDPGAFTLVNAGTYTITVGSNTDNSTGIYSFQIRTP